MNYGQPIFGQNQSGTTKSMSGSQQGYSGTPGSFGMGQTAANANGYGNLGQNQNPANFPQVTGNSGYQQANAFPYQSGMNQVQPQGAVAWQNSAQPNGLPQNGSVSGAFGYGSNMPPQPQAQQREAPYPYAQTINPNQNNLGWNQQPQAPAVPFPNTNNPNYDRQTYTGAIPGNWAPNQQMPVNSNLRYQGQVNPYGAMMQQPQNAGGNRQPYPPQSVNMVQGQGGWPGTAPYQSGYGAGAQPVSQKKQSTPFVMDNTKLIISCMILLFLFVFSFFLFKPWLCFIFAALSVAFSVLLWIKPIVAENTRICVTVICAAMSIIAVVNALMPQNNQTSSGGDVTAVVSVGSNSAGAANQGTQGMPVITENTPAPTVTTAPDSLQTEAVDRLKTFFYYWSGNKVEEMLEICSPAWRSSQDIPKNALYSTMAGRIPLDYTMEKVSGTENDTSRTVTLVSNIDRKNGKDPVKYRMQVVMSYENGAWYVDPRSLASLDAEETTAAVSATPSPTPTPEISGDTILYYNPDGGTKYHLDQSCKSAHAKYLPFKGEFRYKDINNSKYAKMTPCNVCGAPLRPSE